MVGWWLVLLHWFCLLYGNWLCNVILNSFAQRPPATGPHIPHIINSVQHLQSQWKKSDILFQGNLDKASMATFTDFPFRRSGQQVRHVIFSCYYQWMKIWLVELILNISKSGIFILLLKVVFNVCDILNRITHIILDKRLKLKGRKPLKKTC